MAEQVFTASSILLAEFEEAMVPARAEHARLAEGVANLQRRHDDLLREIEALKKEKARFEHMTALAFLAKCVAAGIDKFTLAELRAKASTAAAAA